jgi:hypothetical protein
VGSPSAVNGVCPACNLEAENLLDQVMRGKTPLYLVPSALAAWWLAGDNNAWNTITPVIRTLQETADYYWGLYNYPTPMDLGSGPSYAELCELRGEPERAQAHRETVEALLRDWEARR